MLKKTLSVVLAIITMFSCFGMLSGTVAFADKEKTETGLADSINPQVKFFVPETIYLDTSDRQTFKYIYGSDTDGAAVKDEQSYAVYFDGLNCSPEKVTVTCMASTADNSEDYTAVDAAQISSITLGGTSFTGDEAANTGITTASFPLSTTLDSGVLASAVAAGAYRFIRWQADYVVNGLTYTTYAYSICYSHHSNYAYLRQNSRTYTSNFKSSARIQAEMQVDGLNGGSVSAEQGSRDYAKSSDNSGGTLSRTVSFVVDSSRFSNYSKIPYLAARDNLIFHNDGGSYRYLNLTASNTSKSVSTGNTQNDSWWKYLTIDLPTDGTRVTFYMRAHSRYNGKDVDNYTYVYMNPTNVDKTQLQKAYYDAVSASRQRGWYSEGFDEYQNSILAVAAVVGNPSATDLTKSIDTDVLVYNKYNVKFVNFDGSELKSETVDFGSYASAPEVSTAPDRFDDDYHYAFTGWDNDVAAPITGDIVFTAQYGAIAHDYSEFVEVVTPANCTETGVSVYKCVCSKTAQIATPIDPDNHDLIHHEAKMATCTETGWYEYDTCSRCDYTTFKVMDMVAHTEGEPVRENVVDAKCEENGSYDEVIYCKECGIELAREAKVINALGHDLIHHDAKMSTCTQTGWYEYDTCSRCDYTTFKVMEMADHTPGKAVKVDIIIPKCEKAGSYSEVVYCTECGAELSRESKVINALGHDLVNAAAKAATCSSVGWNEYNYCRRCDYTEYEEIPVDPNAHKYGEWITDTQPGCFTEGTKHRVCEYNDAHVDYGTIPELGYHTWGEGVVTTAPTCSAEGVMTYTCTECSETKTESIPVDPNAHKYGEWVETTPATCLTDGERRMICEYDESHYIAEAIPALGHDIVHHDRKDATCTADGWEAYDSCSRCDYTTYVKINKLGHDFSVFVEHKDSDCANKGYDLYKCSRCDATKKVEYALKAHTWDDGVITKEPTVDNPGEKTYTCKVCGATKIVKLYACSHCDEIFEGDDAYNAHKEEVKKICPYCGYKHDQYFEHMTFIKLKCFLTRLFNLLFGWFKDLGTIAKR